MKNFFHSAAIFVATLVAIRASAATPTVIYSALNNAGAPLTNRITITPVRENMVIVSGTNLVTGSAITLTNGASTTLIPNFYRCTIEGISFGFVISVPDDTNTYNVAALVTNVSTFTGTNLNTTVAISGADTTRDYLGGKLLVDSTLTKTTNSPGGAETLTLSIDATTNTLFTNLTARIATETNNVTTNLTALISTETNNVTTNLTALISTETNNVTTNLTAAINTASNNILATAGLYVSTRSNLVAPTSITVGSSPFSWTNTVSGNVTVLIIGGAVSAISLNGTSLGQGVTNGITPLPLQTNEYVTVTYSSAPTMKRKPF